ncbi:MAG: hypothetical protein IAE87_09750 [Rhodobacteraceae bacterium]|jgi:hypothetical protein|nr:hypothetical protein [Paracoccaceae bacterium]
MTQGARLTETRIRAGIWEGVLTDAGLSPVLEVVLGGQTLGPAEVRPVPGGTNEHAVRVPIPADLLSEGVQTFLIRMGGETLAHFSIITGAALEDDLRAEIDLLRAELDLLKRAFRRHCTETGG